jgi:mannose-6-phosphate isomerase-like protein (cupin superfamily)
LAPRGAANWNIEAHTLICLKIAFPLLKHQQRNMNIQAHHNSINKMSVYPLDKQCELDFSWMEYPTKITIAPNGETCFDEFSTHFVVVQSGEVQVLHRANTYNLQSGLYGCFPGKTIIKGFAEALIVSAGQYSGMTIVGGPVEATGRLHYIDGCTSSILVPPPVCGDPCLNFLHLPSNTAQTMHTHPTLRVGLILSGNGQCETAHGMLDFQAGTAFVIPPGADHSFQSQTENMRIVIYHPDSDSGPTHTDHTMLNRTYVNGRTAKFMTALHRHDGE